MAGLPLIVVVGLDREPSTSLADDLRRLEYRAELISWPAWPGRQQGPGARGQGPRPVVVLVDLRVLGVEAASVCRALRAAPALRGAPLVGVVPEQEAARLDLSIGLDDLLLAPYRLSDLAARLRLLRWRAEKEASAEIIRAGRLALNPATYEVLIDGVPIDLTLKEYQLLLFLLRNPNRVFDRAQLLDRVWGSDYYGGTRTVDVHIRRVRAKTEPAGDLIETVRGVGYRLVVGRAGGE